MKSVCVLSGKGGVGKTTVAAAIARSLTESYKVGLFDADISGSNLHLLLDVKRDFDVVGGRIKPAVATIDGKELEFVSLSLVSESYCDWPGIRHGEFVVQVLEGTDFTADYVIEDLAPGWHEDVAKAVELSDVAVLVALPGKLGALDLKRTIELLRDKRKPVAGAYVNFSKYICPNCGREEKLFGASPGLEVPVIEEIPWTNSLPKLDPHKLLTYINNPVTLLPRSKSVVKRKLMEIFLRRLGR